MKREILHPTCVPKPLSVNAATDPLMLAGIMATGEKTHQVRGRARAGYQCDNCGEPIEKGTPAVAYSISTNDRPHYDWEGDYIDV